MSSVDLPHPDGPTTVTNSPRSTSNDTSWTACVPSGNTIPTWSNDSAGTALIVAQRGAGRQLSRLRCDVEPVSPASMP